MRFLLVPRRNDNLFIFKTYALFRRKGNLPEYKSPICRKTNGAFSFLKVAYQKSHPLGGDF
jgi:hypothetical protein